MDREGPEHLRARTVTVPASTSCFGCKYHDTRMRRSGRAPQYNNECTHPEAYEEKELRVLGSRVLSGVTYGFGQRKYPTPDWCPFLREITPNSTGDGDE